MYNLISSCNLLTDSLLNSRLYIDTFAGLCLAFLRLFACGSACVCMHGCESSSKCGYPYRLILQLLRFFLSFWKHHLSVCILSTALTPRVSPLHSRTPFRERCVRTCAVHTHTHTRYDPPERDRSLTTPIRTFIMVVCAVRSGV